MTDDKESRVPTRESPTPSALTQEKRERLGALSSRIAEAYANVPEDKGVAEIDAAIEELRRR
jgi:hypothetical protein